MSDDPVATTVRDILSAYDISIPDDELAELADVYSALRHTAERVLAADSVALDIALTFDRSTRQ